MLFCSSSVALTYPSRKVKSTLEGHPSSYPKVKQLVLSETEEGFSYTKPGKVLK